MVGKLMVRIKDGGLVLQIWAIQLFSLVFVSLGWNWEVGLDLGVICEEIGHSLVY